MSGFKRTINWNKYQSKFSIEIQSQYLDNLVDSIFHGASRLFLLSFEDNKHGTILKRYFLPEEEIEDCNVMVDIQNFFDQPVKNELKTYDNIQAVATGHGDDYTTGCLLDYPSFKKYHKLITMDQSKQQALDADPKAIK